MPIDELPIPPSRADGANFAARADDFLGALPDFRNQANDLAAEVQDNADIASAAATTAINAPGTIATSTSSLDIGTGLKTLTVQTGKALAVGMTVVIASTASPNTRMQGVITAYNSGTGSLSVDVNYAVGSGTGIAAWTITLGAALSFATSADVRGGIDAVKAVTTKASMDALAAVTIADLTAWSLASAINFRATLTANATIANPTDLVEGKSGRIEIIQDMIGGRTLTWGTQFVFADGIPLSAGTGVGERTIFYYDVLETGATPRILITAVRNVKR